MKKIFAAVALLALSAAVPMRADQSKSEVNMRLDSAASTLRDLAAAPDKGIPDEVYNSAKCIAVVPRMLKGAFIFGGEHGRGVATCKLPNGMWSAPAFFTLSGGSWGLQAGAQDIDLVMMVMTDQGVQHLLQNKFQIGAEASGAAGQVGRHASAGVDWKLDTQILTYSRTKDLFAGINLNGSWIEHDVDSTKALYGKDYSTNELLAGKVPVPMEARGFIDEVARVKAESEKR